MSTSFRRILSALGCFGSTAELPVYSVDSIKKLEFDLSRELGINVLMQRAGLALARFSMAIAPHANRIWIPVGAGNNAGDGFEAAMHLRMWGKEPIITMVNSDAKWSPETAVSLQKAIESGVNFSHFSHVGRHKFDLCIDAVFGTGLSRRIDGAFEECIRAINACNRPVISVDIPSGLKADTGESMGINVRATHTLCMLGLKFGLLSGKGRDATGTVWLNSLGTNLASQATALTNAPTLPDSRLHYSHKGTFGDVAVVGGAPGMQGAAVLAATAAVHAGAGRIFWVPLSSEASQMIGTVPEVMLRERGTLAIDSMTVVAGCGGGTAIEGYMEDLIEKSKNLILDADALNALARSPSLFNKLRKRRMDSTVLTPHPLEAARLLNSTASAINSDRLNAAKVLANKYQCIVVLKGSGSIVSSPHNVSRINLTGNAKLSTGGTGDVLAGMIGSYVSQFNRPFEATCNAVHRHGQVADEWPLQKGLTALELARAL